MSTAFKSTLVSKIGFLTIPIQQAKPFSDVLIGNDVIVFGYPNSVGIPQQSDIDREKPLVRRGIIAGKNEKEKRIILDCPIYQGNSGGPAVQVIESWGEKRFEIIGVVVAVIPLKEDTQNVQFGYTNSNYSNTGLSVALPMDFVFELLD